MSAETLRKAAQQLRDHAKATTGHGRPWFVADCEMYPRWILADDGDATESGYSSDVFRVTEEDVQFETTDPDWQWIATMHPGVGLALADWLDWTFDQGHSGDMDDNGCDECRPALDVARLILGGDS